MIKWCHQKFLEMQFKHHLGVEMVKRMQRFLTTYNDFVHTESIFFSALYLSQRQQIELLKPLVHHQKQD